MIIGDRDDVGVGIRVGDADEGSGPMQEESSDEPTVRRGDVPPVRSRESDTVKTTEVPVVKFVCQSKEFPMGGCRRKDSP